MEQNKQRLYMSAIDIKPIHKFFRVIISSIKYTKDGNSDIMSLHVYKNSAYKTTLPLGHLGYYETNTTFSPTIEIAYGVNNILKLLDICRSTTFVEEISIHNKISDKKRNTDYSTEKKPF